MIGYTQLADASSTGLTIQLQNNDRQKSLTTLIYGTTYVIDLCIITIHDSY